MNVNYRMYIHRTREILSLHIAILPKSKTFRLRRSSSVTKTYLFAQELNALRIGAQWAMGDEGLWPVQ